MMSATTVIRLTALDTLFFRESRPQEALGGSELSSLFPPPPRTVLGAIRTAIGEAMGVDWTRFAHPHDHGETEKRLRQVIGYGDDLGCMRLHGFWLVHDQQRLFPAPMWLLRHKQTDGTLRFARLRIGAVMACRKGITRLPELPPGHAGFKPLEDTWLTAGGMNLVLAGQLPSQDDIRDAGDLYVQEARLGIGRDNLRRTAEDSLLYQTRHIRPRSRLSIEVTLTGLEGVDLSRCLIRLGAEGRLAGAQVVEDVVATDIICPTPVDATCGLILNLLSPARFLNAQGQPDWLPPGFKQSQMGNATVWRGEIQGVSLIVHSAVIGKQRREGGWDMAAHRPRPAQSLIPAGSAWYCTLDGEADLAAAMKQLHGQAIGMETELGRGLIACGLWNSTEFPNV